MKAYSWPLATSCSSPKRNISALRTACAKAIKRYNNNNNNNHNNKKNLYMMLVIKGISRFYIEST